MDLKALFGDKEALTPDELTEALKATKIVDLGDGGYVAQGKYDADVKKLKETATAATEELTTLKAATDGDDGLKTQLATLTKRLEDAEKAQAEAAAGLTLAERKAAVAKVITSPKLQRLALQDAEALVTDDLDFADALAKVIADDPDYAPTEEGDDKETPPVRLRAGDAPKGKADAPDELTDAFTAGLGLVADKKE